MCRFRANDVFKIPGEPAPPSPECLFRQLHRQNRVLAPGQNEMSRAINESIDIRPFEQNDELARHREYLRAQLLSRNKKSEIDDTKMISPNSISSNNSVTSEERKSSLPNIEISSPTSPAVSSTATRSTPEMSSSGGTGSNESERDQHSQTSPAEEHQENQQMEF